MEYDYRVRKRVSKELYEDGKCNSHRYRFDAAVIKKYQKRIDTLIAATRIED